MLIIPMKKECFRGVYWEYWVYWSVFYALEKLSTIFIQFEIVVCKFFQCGRVYYLSFGKGLLLQTDVPLRTYIFGVVR